jgi:enoyl-CoA hydratase
MSAEVLLIETKDNFRILTINREKALNALNKEVFDALHAFFSNIQAPKPDLRGVIITGAGSKAFVAGADIKEFSDFTSPAELERLSLRGQMILDLIENCPVPVIAAVNGFALGGGCELAMACHLRIAGKHAKFGQPEVNLGLTPGYGGTQRLTRLVGRGKALELLMTADMIGAEQAVQLGLANEMVDTGLEVQHSLEILQKISTKAPLAVRDVIKAVNAYEDPAIDGFGLEAHFFGQLLKTTDFREGVNAFKEKRKPDFKCE